MKRSLLCTLAAAMLAAPLAAHLENGQIWLIDKTNSALYRIDPVTWQVFTTFSGGAGGLNGPGAIGFNLHGDMMIANYNTSEILEYDGLTPPVVVADATVGLNGPFGATGAIISPGHGDIYLSNFDANQILVLDETFANPMVFADAADGIIHPVAMAFLANGELVVGNEGSGGDILTFDELGNGSLFDSLPGIAEISAMSVRDNGDLFVLTIGGFIFKYAGGDPLARSQLGQYGPAALGGIEFSPDFSEIYHVNQGNGEFRTIDPDTGVDVVRATLTGKRPIAIAVTGGQIPHGTFAPFGEGLAGAGGLTPLLESHDEPRIGQPGTLHIGNTVGGSFAYLFMGLGEDEVQILGGDFHIDISGATFWTMKIFATGGVPGLAGDGLVTLPFTLPNDPILIGTEWFLEALVDDPGAPFGYSFSNCSKMYVGDAP